RGGPGPLRDLLRAGRSRPGRRPGAPGAAHREGLAPAGAGPGGLPERPRLVQPVRQTLTTAAARLPGTPGRLRTPAADRGDHWSGQAVLRPAPGADQGPAPRPDLLPPTPAAPAGDAGSRAAGGGGPGRSAGAGPGVEFVAAAIGRVVLGVDPPVGDGARRAAG